MMDIATLGQTIVDAQARSAYLAPPYDVVGPFDLDELETHGRIAFGACLVMSRQRWHEDQTTLRMAAREKRRAALAQSLFFPDPETEHREALDLTLDGPLKAAQINAAFRRMARIAHPDTGGSGEHYRRISHARDTLLTRLRNTPEA